MLYAAFRYPGVVEHVGALEHPRRQRPARSPTSSARCSTGSRRSPSTPAAGTVFYTDDNLALARPDGGGRRHAASERMLLKDARIGEIVFNPVDRSLMGVRHANGLATLVRIPYPYSDWQAGRTRSRTSRCPTTSTSPPTDGCSRRRCSEVNGDQFLRVWELDEARCRATLTPLSEFRFGQSVPESFVFSHDGRYLYGSSYYTGRVEHLPLRSGHGKDRGGVERRDRILPAGPAAPTAGWWCSTTPARASSPAIIDPRPIEDVSAITFLGAEVAARHPVVTTWQVPPASTVDYDAGDRRQGSVRARCAASPLDNALSGPAGLQELRRRSAITLNFADSLGLARIGITAAYTPDSDLPAQRAGPRRHHRHYLGWRGELSWNRSDFYDLFGPTKRSRKGYAAKLGYDHLLIYDEPRKLELKSRRRLLRPDRHAAERAERRHQFHPADHRRDRAALHRRAALARRGRRREGARLDAGADDQSRATARSRRRFAARSTSASPLPLAQLVDLAARRRRRRRRRRTTPPSRTSTSAASATTTSTTARSSAIARLRLPGLRAPADQRPQLRARRWWSGTRRRTSSNPPARRSSTRPGCGRRSSRRRCGRSRRNASLRTEYTQRRRAGRPALLRAALVRA